MLMDKALKNGFNIGELRGFDGEEQEYEL